MAAAGENDTNGDFPLRRWLGMDLETTEAGTTVASMTITPEHLNPNGVVHGAVPFALIDTGMGGATMSVVEPGQYCASVDVNLRYIRGSSSGRLIATTTVVKKGRTVVHLESRVVDGDDRLIATAVGTFAIFTT